MKKLIIPIILCLALCGCYDSVEIDDLAYVVALGIDKGENKNYEITFQYAVPLGIGSGVESGGEKGDKPLYSLTFESDSIRMATAYADKNLAKTTDLSHLNAIILSKDIAKEGINSFKRDLFSSTRTTKSTYLAVCNGKASDCLNSVTSPLELNPSRFYDDFFTGRDSAYSVKQTALELSNGKSTFAVPYLTFEDSLKNAGMVAFKDGKLTSFFTLEEALMYNILKGEFTNLKFETANGVFNLDSELSPKYSIDIKDGLKIKIKLSLSGKPETGKDILFKNTKTTEKILINSLKQKLLLFLQKTRDENCDILTLSSHAKRKFLTEEEFIRYNWDEKFKDAVFDISIAFRNTENISGG